MFTQFIFFFFALSGDNILTAVNVARACGMVLTHDKVIFVHASPPTANSVASLQFHEGDGASATINTQETIDIPAQVCLFDLLSALQMLPLTYHTVMSLLCLYDRVYINSEQQTD